MKLNKRQIKTIAAALELVLGKYGQEPLDLSAVADFEVDEQLSRGELAMLSCRIDDAKSIIVNDYETFAEVCWDLDDLRAHREDWTEKDWQRYLLEHEQNIIEEMESAADGYMSVTIPLPEDGEAEGENEENAVNETIDNTVKEA